MIPFTIKLENGTRQVLNLSLVKRFSFVPEPDDESHPRLADDPPPGIVAVLLYDVEFTVTVKGADADRLLAAMSEIRKLTENETPASLYGLLEPEQEPDKGDIGE